MHNLLLLLLDCVVVLMIIGPQSVSAQALGAVYFRGSGSINPQAISPNRVLIPLDLIFHFGLLVEENDSIMAAIVFVSVVLLGYCLYKSRESWLAPIRAVEAARRERNSVVTR